MLCDDFDTRLQNLLDARKSPQRDLSLRRHARQCRHCQAHLNSLARLLDGLELLDVPALPNDFAQRVVEQVSGPSRRGTPSTRTLLAVALAASVLIVIAPMSWYLVRRFQTVANIPQTTAAPTDELAQAGPAVPTPDQLSDAEEGWLVPGAAILELYPEEARQRHREQVNQIADDLRPIATPFNAAMAAIRRSMPTRHSPPKGEPRASLARPPSELHLS
jgi:hypothetical protein